VIRGVHEFSELSNFARIDIANFIKSRKLKKSELIIDKNYLNTAHCFVLLEGKVRLFTTEKSFKEYQEEKNIVPFTENLNLKNEDKQKKVIFFN